jgi:hypothetical protein
MDQIHPVEAAWAGIERALMSPPHISEIAPRLIQHKKEETGDVSTA